MIQQLRNIFVKCLLISLIFSGRLMSQDLDKKFFPQPTPPSPNVASLGLYGQIPVSLFSGLPQISIPIGSVSSNGTSIDINLGYHGGGIRPDAHSGWVGLGWDLAAGGMITRRMIGGMDEIIRPNGTLPPRTYRGYYYMYAEADRSDWASTARIAYFLDDLQNPPIYPSPDEFIFNFGKYSGSFFLNHKGKWQVRSKDLVNITIKEELVDNYVLTKQTGAQGNFTIRRLFHRFTLTTPDGCKYIFGGTSSSIEFTRTGDSGPYDTGGGFESDFVIPTAWHLTKIITPVNDEINFNYERDNIIATVSISLLRSHYQQTGQSAANAIDLAHSTTSIINPCYLKEIVSPDQTVKFYRSNSNELPYEYYGTLQGAIDYDDLSANQTATGIKNNIKWKKLDSVVFESNRSGFLRKFVFQYTEQVTSRLILNSVQEIGRGGLAKPPYLFTYNTTALPGYGTQQLDHWGFYNGVNYFTANPKSPITLYTDADVPAYTTSRNSNFTLMKAGILTAIKYPTGGSTSFEYEPHEYSMIAKRFPFEIQNLGTNNQCGGLRIRKIVSEDALNNVTSKEYLYVKNHSGGGTTSSGVLAGEPKYIDQGSYPIPNGTLTYYYWYDFHIEPLSFTDGNHVTYSEVIEKSLDGSYSVYNYSNHDQSLYIDTLPQNGVYTAANQWRMDPTTSKADERGKLLEKRDFTSAGKMLRKVKYEYDESVKYLDPVRTMQLSGRWFGEQIQDSRVTAYLIFASTQPLLKEIDTLWDENGSNPVVTVKEHLYNNTYRSHIQQQFTNSKGATIKSTFKYPFDFLGTAVYKEMTDSNRIAHIIEQTDFNNSTQINFARTNFYKPFTRIYVPQTVEIQDQGSTIETRVRFEQYSNKGDILTIRKESDHRISYIWDYYSTSPIAEVINAVQTDIACTSFEADGIGNWTLSDLLRNNTYAVTGKRSYNLVSGTNITKSGLSSSKTYIVSYWSRNGAATVNSTAGVSGPAKNGWTYWEHVLPNTTTSVTVSGSGKTIDELRLYPETARMTTYTYEPLIGMSSKCDANNRVTYFEYDGLGRLIVIKDQDNNIVKTVDYHYRGN